MLLSLNRVADGDHRPDEGVQVHAPGQEARRVACRIPVIAVEGYVIDVVVALLQHGQLPVPEGGHVIAGGPAGDQLDGGIHPLHELRGFVGGPAVLPGRLVAHLPGAVHFVAQTPEPDVQRVLRPVPDPHVAEPGPAGMVGVLHDVPGVLRPPGPQVDRVHDPGIRLPGPVREFMQAHLVGLRGEPGQVQPAGPVRAHAVLPVEAGHEVAPGIPHHRNAQPPDHFQHVPAKALLVRQGMPRLIDAAVDGPAQVLDEGSEKTGVDPSDGVVLIQYDPCLLHGSSSFLQRASSASQAAQAWGARSAVISSQTVPVQSSVTRSPGVSASSGGIWILLSLSERLKAAR